MDKSTIFGLIIGFVSLVVGMVLKGVTLSALLNPAAILIIIFGTIATIVIGFPMNELKRVPKLFGVIFKEAKLVPDVEVIKMFSSLADLARREGLLALESRTTDVEDPFFKKWSYVSD